MEHQDQNDNYKPDQGEGQERRSIRDLRISRPQQKRETRQVARPASYDYDEGEDTGRPWAWYAAAAAVVCLLLAAALPVVFPVATVAVTPVRVQTGPSSVLTAYPEEQDGAIKYTVETWDVSDSKSVPATSTQTVSEKASGMIKITNANTAPQKLIKNTRFESATGKIYRIRDSVTVPASGTLDVKVYADEGGESFNVDKATFTVPGLKSSPLFAKVTAASTTAITGGFSGTKKTISTEDKKRIAAEIEQGLVEKVRAGTGHPSSDLLIRKTTSVTFDDPKESSDGDSAVISLTGHAKGLFVSSQDLAYGLSVEAGTHLQSKNVTFTTQPPTVEVAGQVDPAQYGKSPVRIAVDGTQSLVYTVNREQLARDLAGTSRDDVKTTLSKYPEIEKAVATVRPFWRSTLPSNAEKITIVVDGDTK